MPPQRAQAQAQTLRPVPWPEAERVLVFDGPAEPAEADARRGMAPSLRAARGPSLGLAGGLERGDVERLSREARPGLNLGFYDLGPDCDREPFGVLANLHKPGVRQRVTDILVELRARGSEAIAVGIYHFRPPGPADADGVWAGTPILDSTGGDLHPRMRQNLADLLADIRAAGFSQLLVRYHPQGGNTVTQWTRFEEELFQENWNLIVNLMPILDDSGLDYRVDLLTEGLPRARFVNVLGQALFFPDLPDNELWSRYANRLWRNYVSRFDPGRSVGFSSVGDTDPNRLRARLEHLGYVYSVAGGERVYPGAFAFSIYGTPDVDEGELYGRIVDRLRRLGFGDVPLIVAESFYNDREGMARLAAAAREQQAAPLYVLHWPVARDRLDCSTHVNVGFPVEIDQALRFGF
ncbi:hypothetical protein [Aquimonas voraii]|uniref:hypothetical protein n=1 Tax=Aquimonas voraii TaxID=265719 RepID=UPI000B89F667|nr:hypothetical protein [Aquimonas voraii]